MEHTTWAEVDLSAIAHNARSLQQHITAKTILCAVVKANGYGHGALPVAKTALRNGAQRLAVGRVEEGAALRQAGIEAPILLMCYAIPGQATDIVRYGLTPTVNSLDLGRSLSRAVAEHGAPDLPLHIKIDTGMGRFGVLPEEALDFAQALAGLPGLSLEGLYTHFCTADEADIACTSGQFEVYQQVVARLEQAGLRFAVHHVANSAATLRFPHMHLDMVRCGIALYGLRPSPDTPLPFPLRPAMALKSRVGRVRTLPAGWGISYGRDYVTSEPTRVALVPLGYGDGYHRLLSSRGAVLIHGQRAPILGRVCMDQFVVSVHDIEGVKEGDEVVLFGRQGQAELPAEEVAAWAETIDYEVVTSVLSRVPRVYLGE